jgi:hypothetical protein
MVLLYGFFIIFFFDYNCGDKIIKCQNIKNDNQNIFFKKYFINSDKNINISSIKNESKHICDLNPEHRKIFENSEKTSILIISLKDQIEQYRVENINKMNNLYSLAKKGAYFICTGFCLLGVMVTYFGVKKLP